MSCIFQLYNKTHTVNSNEPSTFASSAPAPHRLSCRHGFQRTWQCPPPSCCLTQLGCGWLGLSTGTPWRSITSICPREISCVQWLKASKIGSYFSEIGTNPSLFDLQVSKFSWTFQCRRKIWHFCYWKPPFPKPTIWCIVSSPSKVQLSGFPWTLAAWLSISKGK